MASRDEASKGVSSIAVQLCPCSGMTQEGTTCPRKVPLEVGLCAYCQAIETRLKEVLPSIHLSASDGFWPCDDNAAEGAFVPFVAWSNQEDREMLDLAERWCLKPTTPDLPLMAKVFGVDDKPCPECKRGCMCKVMRQERSIDEVTHEYEACSICRFRRRL